MKTKTLLLRPRLPPHAALSVGVLLLFSAAYAHSLQEFLSFAIVFGAIFFIWVKMGVYR